jgi:hypothetical protein
MRVPLDTMPCKFGTKPRKQGHAFFPWFGKGVFGTVGARLKAHPIFFSFSMD